MAKKQFKAESKKLLDLMINSLYTHREIFLRELLSNASDALDKLYYLSLKSGSTGIQRSDFHIDIAADKENRTITVTDNGIGMTAKELESDLGTIAKSGSLAFIQEHIKGGKETDQAEGKTRGDIDIIGQFGVGFYSAFMVSEKVKVTSKAYGSDEAFAWESGGADGYTIEPAEKDGNGTEIVLYLKPSGDEENYDEYLEEYTIRRLVKKYSDYIRYPIRTLVTKYRPVKTEESAVGETPGGEGQETEEGKARETEEYKELETLNSMEPIWKRRKEDVKAEDYNEYYKGKFGDYTDPIRVIRTSVEGVSSYTALLFIPGRTPYDYYSSDYEKGLQLYSSGVLVMDKCKELLPDYFNFVKGLVDSQDLSLNVSREMLQHDRQLRSIARNLEKKIKNDLLDFLEKDREGYEKFFKNFGKQIKYGLYYDFGAHKEVLQDLVLFYSSMEKKMVTFGEYAAKMGEDQKYIYYAAGESIDKIGLLPQTEFIRDKGFEILYLTDEVDEFVLRMIRDYKGKEFKSVSAEDIADGESGDVKDGIKKAEEENRELLDFIKETLDGKVTEVRFSPRLKNSAVCLTAKGGFSIEMEKVLKSMPIDEGLRAERILEINPSHRATEALKKAFAEDKDKVKILAELLYNQALLISGLTVDNPVEFGENMWSLITG